MRITEEQISLFRKNGFLIIENFLSADEREAALEGFYECFAPSYDEFIASGRVNENQQKQKLFPWNHSGLNHAMTHPDLIDAAERIIGTRELRLCESSLGMKYFGEPPNTTAPGLFHIDYGNNTLGPIIEPDDYQHLIFFYCFDDVKPGMAPIQMVPNGRSDSEAQKMIVPGGSVCIYSIFTRHASTEFTEPGHRPVAWVGYSRKDRPWDGARTFTYKSGASYEGMHRFIVEASPRELELIGFPPPGDVLWTRSFIEGMAKRYEGFRTEPYLEMLAE